MIYVDEGLYSCGYDIVSGRPMSEQEIRHTSALSSGLVNRKFGLLFRIHSEKQLQYYGLQRVQIRH